MDEHAAVAAPAEFKVAFALHLGADLLHRLEPSRQRRAGDLRSVMFAVSASGQLGNKCLKLFGGHSCLPLSSSTAFSHNIAWRVRLRWCDDVAERAARRAIRASASDRIAACAQDRYGMTLPDTRYECRSPRSADLTRRRSGGAGLRPRDGHQRLASAARKLQSPGAGDLEGQAPAVGGMRARRNSGVCEARESTVLS